MALDRNSTDTAYLIGRMVALTEAVCKTPRTLPALVAVNPLEKLTPWMAKAAAATDNDGQKEWNEIAGKMGELPSRLTSAEQGRMWMGYYHQVAELDGTKVRLHTICKAYGTTVPEVARKLGVTPSALRARLNGNPTKGKLEELAAAIGCPITTLL